MRVSFTRAVTLRQYSAATVDGDGFAVDTATDTAIRANIQPLSGKAREVLPEGDRHRDGIRYATNDAVVRTASQHDGHRADELIVGGITYEVMTAATWSSFPPAHTEGLALRAAEAPTP